MFRLKRNLAIPIIIMIISTSCGPINFFTRMKKTPREYSVNYCGDIIKAPKTELNKKVWIVLSDRENNATFQNPGGKVKLKDVGFLEPFVVIKEKGEYLCLVKYNPEIVDPNLLKTKFKDGKKAEYYGWINKSNLLLTRQSVTDISTGFKNKQISIISDTIPLKEPELYFTKDSIKVFKDMNLSIESSKIPFYDIIYTLKLSPDKEKTLIAKTTEISPDKAKEEVLGWVHSSLVKNIGRRLFVNSATIPQDSFLFKDRYRLDTLLLSDDRFELSRRITYNAKSLKYTPVNSWFSNDSIVALNTNISMPILDKGDNFVFNVNGNKISYSRFKELEKDLKNINLLFVFEGKQQLIENFPMLINVIQNLQPLFEKSDDGFNYQFGAVIASQGISPDSRPAIIKKELTSNYSELVEYMINETTNNRDKFKPLPTNHTWSGLRAAVDMVRNRKEDTNLLMIMGEAGYSESVDTLFMNKIADSNCRLLGFQLFGEINNAGNNFVLQVENMIDFYANKKTKTKREMIVYVDQLRNQNRYRESQKNIYTLDFPKKSMTQGWILFPEKDATVPLDVLTNSIDTLISQVKWDNDNLINSLYKAFNSVGNYRYKYDSLFVEYYHPKLELNKRLPSYFTEMPLWYLPSRKVVIPDSLSTQVNYHLLLSKGELDELIIFMESLYANEVDYKYQGKGNKLKRICNCPDDDLIEEVAPEALGQKPEYRSTRLIRKELQKLYLRELKTCRVCKKTLSKLKNYSLAEAQRNITECPTYTSNLEKYTLKGIRNKKHISDQELDDLITYFKNKKDELNRYLHEADKFESNGQTYYWIDRKYLP